MGFKRRKLTAVCIFFRQRRHGNSVPNSESVSNAKSVSNSYSVSDSHTFSFAFANAVRRPAHASVHGHCEIRY